MKAIETEYAGVRFRSRLEARWAVFFDTVGIQWEYEPEAFRLSDGSGYLPDFRLLEPSCIQGMPFFTEVKPEGDAFVKARQASREMGREFILLAGPPTEGIGARLTRHPEGHECGDAGWCAGAGCCDDCADDEIFFFGRKLLADSSGGNWDAAVARVRAHRFWEPRA